MTAAVRDYVWNKLGVELTDLGERQLKNISRPVRVYRLERRATPVLRAASSGRT
jgi:class 3 adenylate cyclase